MPHSGARRGGEEPPVTSEPWTRAEWLTAANAYAANPRDPASSRTFQKLITTDAWRRLDKADFAAGGEVLQFFPAIKKLTLALGARGAANEMIALGLYSLDVHRAFFDAGMAFIDTLPVDDPSRATRHGGLDKMRRAAAMEVCALLYLGIQASPKPRDAMIAALSDPRTLSFSREGLQLIIATLDEKLLPKVGPSLREPYRAVRDAVAREHAKAPETSSVRTTYQGIDAPTVIGQTTKTVVSRTGSFSVETNPTALVKRVDDGSTSHWIEVQEGAARYDAACFNGATEAQLVARVPAMTPRASTVPGQWFTTSKDGIEARLRFVTIEGRGCVASVEAPSATFPAARADAFLGSLTSAP